jgi:hypothetical protein
MRAIAPTAVVLVVGIGLVLTERVAARELWFLRISRGQFVADAVQKSDVALLRVLLEGGDESPRHGARGLRSNGGVRSVMTQVKSAHASSSVVCVGTGKARGQSSMNQGKWRASNGDCSGSARASRRRGRPT